jgi:hypothetical protein
MTSPAEQALADLRSAMARVLRAETELHVALAALSNASAAAETALVKTEADLDQALGRPESFETLLDRLTQSKSAPTIAVPPGGFGRPHND